MRSRTIEERNGANIPGFGDAPAVLEGVEHRGNATGSVSFPVVKEESPRVSTPTRKKATETGTAGFVHPYARKLAGLLSPMSLQDQEVASRVSSYLIFSSLFFSFPVAFWMENILISAGAITLAGIISFILFLPNWRQRKDPEMQWVPRAEVYYYYKNLAARRQELKREKSKDTAPITEMPDTVVFAPVAAHTESDKKKSL